MKHLPHLLVFCTLLATTCGVHSQTFDAPKGSKAQTTAIAEWKQLMHAVSEAITAQRACTADESQVTIVDAAKFSSKGPSVALIGGCHGDVKHDPLIVMRLEDGQPVLAEFRGTSGQPVAPEFMRNDSQLDARGVQLVPHGSAIVSTSDKRDEHNQALDCSVGAYVWNPHTKTFDWNARQTKKAFSNACHVF
jgi:hypothetical protein